MLPRGVEPNSKPDMSVTRKILIPFLAPSALLAAAAAAVFAGMARPDLGAFLAAAPVIQAHVIVAVAAVVLGAGQLLAVKGTASHRAVGYAWAGLMSAAAVSAVFIREINDGRFSFIHLFVPLTFFGLLRLISHARARRVARHKRIGVALFFGALITPGLFAFVPGRLMHHVFFGA